MSGGWGGLLGEVVVCRYRDVSFQDNVSRVGVVSDFFPLVFDVFGVLVAVDDCRVVVLCEVCGDCEGQDAAYCIPRGCVVWVKRMVVSR